MSTLSQELKRLLRVPEVARILDTSEGRVYEMIRQNIIPSVHLGRQLRVDRKALEAWIEGGGQALSGGWRREK